MNESDTTIPLVRIDTEQLRRVLSDVLPTVLKDVNTQAPAAPEVATRATDTNPLSPESIRKAVDSATQDASLSRIEAAMAEIVNLLNGLPASIAQAMQGGG